MAKRIIFPEKGQVILEPFDPGVPGPDEVQVLTRYSLMSIGTETTILHQKYDAGTHFDRIFSFPQYKTGVQAVGTVQTVGERVSEFSPGDRVFMRMAHGSHQTLPALACSPVPEDIDDIEACWCGLAKTAFRAAWAARFSQCDHVLIVGAGPVGQMTLRWAVAEAVSEIAVTDLSEFRLELAGLGGATRTFAGDLVAHAEEIAGMNNATGPAVIVDTTGNPAVFKQALGAAGRYGRVILLGDTGYPQRQCLTSDVMSKGLTIQATHDSHDRDDWTQRRIDRYFFDCVLDSRFMLDGLITHEFDPRDCESAYELAEHQRHQAMGILFDWQQCPD